MPEIPKIRMTGGVMPHETKVELVFEDGKTVEVMAKGLDIRFRPEKRTTVLLELLVDFVDLKTSEDTGG
jgi:hypothetical protein